MAKARTQAERVALSVGLKCAVVRRTDRRDRTKKECQQRATATGLDRREHPINFQWTLKGSSNELRNHGRRHRRALSGRGRRRTCVRLSRRRRSLHLRRHLQAGQIPAHSRSSRASSDSRSRCLFAQLEQGGGRASDFRSRCHQCGDGSGDCVHGFHSDGDHFRTGADPRDRSGCLPGM